jgi:hypothetical protein
MTEFPPGRPSFIRKTGRQKKSEAEILQSHRFNRRLLEMRLEGMRLQEIADYYEMSIGGVWPRIEAARADLRNGVG